MKTFFEEARIYNMSDAVNPETNGGCSFLTGEIDPGVFQALKPVTDDLARRPPPRHNGTGCFRNRNAKNLGSADVISVQHLAGHSLLLSWALLSVALPRDIF